jgi:hypothetical protein
MKKEKTNLGKYSQIFQIFKVHKLIFLFFFFIESTFKSIH